MRYLLVLVLIVLLIPVVASTTESTTYFRYSWELSVIYPDGEEKNFFVSPGGGKIPLKSKAWKCEYLKPSQRDKYATETVVMSCVYKDIFVLSTASCGNTGRRVLFDEGVLCIGEPKSAAHHTITITCR